MLRIFLFTFAFYFIPNIFGSNQAHAFFFIQEEEKEGNEAVETPSDETKNSINKVQRSNIKITKPISTFEQQKTDLMHYFSKEKTQKIKVDTNEYVMLEEDSATHNNKGVVILLPDWQRGLTHSKAINNLRESLPQNGWSTISIQSPNKPTNYPSSALENKDVIEQNSKALMLYQNELKSLMNAVIEKAKNYPGIFLVISEGSQAAMLVNLFKDNQSLLPAALITLSAGMYSQPENELFAKNMAMSELPVLDLILTRDNKLVLENAILRKKYATKEMKVYYRQKKLSNITPGDYPEKKLITEINGWLKSIGW